MEKAVKEWVEYDPNPETRDLIRKWWEEKNLPNLENALSKRLEFGTAGLRGPMGPGTAAMNDLVVIQTTQGLCSYLEQVVGPSLRSQGIVVGYDHRKQGSLHSKKFALYIAAVFISRGVPVYLFNDFVVTPLVPFTIEYKKCAAGIMVTASHNPKQDNGYKLYWSNGCQIIPPHDSAIAKLINQSLKPWQVYDIDSVQDNCLVTVLTEDIEQAYVTAAAATLCRYPEQNNSSALKIAYTAMHGVGHKLTAKLFAEFKHLPYIQVEQQVLPDPQFPTVDFPNPEEGKGALKISFAVAEKNACTLVLANDPDADRLAVAEKTPNGEWKIFTGNEIAALLAHWEWTQYMEKHPNAEKQDVYMVASTVSSKMLRAIAKKEGFNFEETLTGFKWMGNRTDELRQAGKTVLFSFEEAIGFCVGNVVKDKDGVTAAAVFAEMAKALLNKGKTVAQQLEHLYSTYGYFITQNHYVKCFDPEITNRIFKRLRNDGHYAFRCGSYRIAQVRDMTTGFDSSRPDGRTVLPVSPNVHMITYTFSNGFVATLRTSGTEPKIKYYVEACCAPGVSYVTGLQELQDFVAVFVDRMLQPTLNKLEYKKC